MSIEKPYVPSKAEMKKAEGMAAETEINISIKQAFEKWQPKNNEFKKSIEQGNERRFEYEGADRGKFGSDFSHKPTGEAAKAIRDFESLEIEKIELPPEEGDVMIRAIKILPNGLIIEKSESFEHNMIYIEIKEESKFREREHFEYNIKETEKKLEKIKNYLELLKNAKDKLDTVFGKLKS